jgi:hypothetical protein
MTEKGIILGVKRNSKGHVTGDLSRATNEIHATMISNATISKVIVAVSSNNIGSQCCNNIFQQ